MAYVVIIDDDPTLQVLLEEHCNLLGHTAESAGSIAEAREILNIHPPDLVFLDVRLPDGSGLDFIKEVQGVHTLPEIIIITGQGDDNGAELAIKNGVWDYLEKPLSFQDIVLHIRRALEYHEKKIQNRRNINLKREAIIGESKALKDCLEQIAHCALTDTGVLLIGETGTGKELVARAIHENSLRAEQPFITIDCTNLPADIAESILFGHTKGSFTGAFGDHRGLVELADKGTLFLDEVGELPLKEQKSFLRVLQEKCFRPVGKSKEIKSDFRLISATNRDLGKMVDEGSFRADLYFRLNTIRIELPPLRARLGDIAKLVMHFIFDICNGYQLPVKGLVPESLAALESYPWPGNVRELRNVLEKAILADPTAPFIYPIHLLPEIRLSHRKSKKAGSLQDQYLDTNSPQFLRQLPEKLAPFKECRQKMLIEMEQFYLQQLMAVSGSDVEKACEVAQLGRSRLYELLKKHHLL